MLCIFGLEEPATSDRRESWNAWFRNRGVIELDDGPRSESYVKKSALQSQSSSEFWARDMENDARSSEGVLPFMGTNGKGKNVVFKHTVTTVVETRDRR
jgi:hypothetical protein